MSELQWEVVVEGLSPLRGSCSMEKTLSIHPQVPAGKLVQVKAWLPWPLEEGEKLFFNGYQSWTWCPEYDRNARQRGVNHIPGFLNRQYAFDRYGDYHFMDYPRKKGCFHGFSYGYFRKGDRYRLFASLDEKPGYTVFSYDVRKQVLEITRDCAGVIHPGGSFQAFDLVFPEGSEAQVFDRWFSALPCRPRTEKRLSGYTSWYNRYENITQQTVLEDLQGCRTLLEPGDLFQIDDGWEPNVGDWLEPNREKFPEGMEALSQKIHDAGFRSGLWLAPFACTENSRLFREHPQWLLQVDGKPWKGGCNWGGFYALDFDHPQVQDYLRRVFHRVLEEWNYDLVKLDFLYAAAPVGNERESRAGRMVRAMEFLRSLCGDRLMLACGVPLMPAFGLADYCRVGCDVSLSWDDVWYMRLFHRERNSTRHSLDNTYYRRQLSGRAFGSDPDVFFLREDNCRLTDAQKEQLAQWNARYGQVLFTSDNPGTYSPEQKERYRALRKAFFRETK